MLVIKEIGKQTWQMASCTEWQHCVLSMQNGGTSKKFRPYTWFLNCTFQIVLFYKCLCSLKVIESYGKCFRDSSSVKGKSLPTDCRREWATS